MARRGRPVKFDGLRMRKSSLALPHELVEALRKDARASGFHNWSEQLRWELMFPRGLWREATPVLPTRCDLSAPSKSGPENEVNPSDMTG